MFGMLLAALLIAATIHALKLDPRTRARVGEIFMVYVLAGYCGFPMLAVSIGILAVPERMAEMLPVGTPTQLLAFFGWAYLGMSLMAVLTLRYRGSYLIAPALCWAVYFAGATLVHFHGAGAHMSHGRILATFATHGLITVVLAIALVASGQLTRPASA